MHKITLKYCINGKIFKTLKNSVKMLDKIGRKDVYLM